MIHAAFFVKNGRQAGFTVSGHSGLAGFSNGTCEVRSGDNSVAFRTGTADAFSEALLNAFRDELTALQAEYPDHLRVCVSNELERTN